MKNVSESLAGRVAILRLQGLSDFEISKTSQIEPFIPEYDYLLNISNIMKPQKLQQQYSLNYSISIFLLMVILQGNY